MGRQSPYQRYSTNPFLAELVLHNGKKIKNAHVIASDTGEYLGALSRSPVSDTERFIKYFPGRSGWWRSKLSRNGFLLRDYIFEHLQKNKDFVLLEIAHIIEWCEFGSKKQAYQGIREMVNGGVITMSDLPGKWWINPALFFNGDRKKVMIKSYEKQKRGDRPQSIASRQIRRVGRVNSV